MSSPRRNLDNSSPRPSKRLTVEAFAPGDDETNEVSESSLRHTMRQSCEIHPPDSHHMRKYRPSFSRNTRSRSDKSFGNIETSFFPARWYRTRFFLMFAIYLGVSIPQYSM